MKCGEYKIDLGCGLVKEKGFIGIDIGDAVNVDIVRDIDKHGLPFCDNSAIKIRAVSFFEHIENLKFVLNECWRVLKEDGCLEGRVPNGMNREWMKDPTHKSHFVKETFEKYFNIRSWHRYKLYGFKPWKIIKLEESDKSIEFKMQPYKEGVLD